MATLKSIDYFKEWIPNEITLKILTELEKMDLKRARFTCKKLASLGGQILVVNLYLSPREKDMQVFDAVTQHPDLKKSVKNIIFDTAYFKEDTSREYVYAVRQAYRVGKFNKLGQAQSTLEDMYAALGLGSCYGSFESMETEELIHHPVILEGYRLFNLHAQEHGNILLSSWYNRAFEGLKSIGRIRAAVMGNSWNTIYCPDGSPALGPDESDESLFHIGLFHAITEVHSKRISSDGIRLVGSPSARTWLPTVLQPTDPEPFYLANFGFTPDPKCTIGCIEFVQFVKLLHTTGKQPLRFQATCATLESYMMGLPVNLFDSTKSPESAHFIPLSDQLNVLELTLAARLDGSANVDLGVLKDFIERARSVTTLKLYLPYGNSLDHTSFPLLRASQVFPPVATMVFPKLTTVHLEGISFFYRDLASFLFLSLPNLTKVKLWNILLWHGKWQDIIEGLRSLKELEYCLMWAFYFRKDGVFYSYFDKYDNKFRDEHVRYILRKIDRHPKLKEGKPRGASAIYLARLNKTLEEVRAD